MFDDRSFSCHTSAIPKLAQLVPPLLASLRDAVRPGIFPVVSLRSTTG